MKLQSNDFELFGLAQQFAQDEAALQLRWKALQREAHPDKFSAQGAAAQRVAMQWSARINEAYQRLKNPLQRAAYLCELAGVALNAHTNTAMQGAFLMQQMQWREALDEAPDRPTVQALIDKVGVARQQLLAQCAQLLDVQHDFHTAAQRVRELMFVEKFALDLEQALDTFE